MLIPGIDLDSSQAALNLADQYAEIYAAIGVHPNCASSWDDDAFLALEQMSQHPKIVAIGEIGLDYYRRGAPVDLQKRVFREQLELARSLGLPVIIHNRESSVDVQEILTDWIQGLNNSESQLTTRPGVLHSFSGDMAQAQWAIERNFFVGINGPVTYKNAMQMQHVAREIPLDRLLIETDSPYLPPHHHRGERNEPAHVAIIAGKIAELRTVDIEDIAQATSDNAAILFGWRKID
jgi:TatD DNase family protein